MHLSHGIGVVVEQSHDALGVTTPEGEFLFDLPFHAQGVGVLVKMLPRRVGIGVIDVAADADGPFGSEPLFPTAAAPDVMQEASLMVEDGVGDDLFVSGILLGIVAGEIVSNIFSSLVQFDPELGLIPDLAETWTVSDDGLQYS